MAVLVFLVAWWIAYSSSEVHDYHVLRCAGFRVGGNQKKEVAPVDGGAQVHNLAHQGAKDTNNNLPHAHVGCMWGCWRVRQPPPSRAADLAVAWKSAASAYG